MYGNNPIRKQELKPADGRLSVEEVFYSIQGEGPFAGVPVIFIRLSGCNLSCHFCDTEFESGIDQRLTPQEILHVALESVPAGGVTPHLVVITGGEPFRQDLRLIVPWLFAQGFHVQIETSGTLWIDGFEEYLNQPVRLPDCCRHPVECTIVVSPKTGKVHPKIAQYAAAWKYIVRVGEISQEDGLPCMSTQVRNQTLRLARPPQDVSTHCVYLQPCDEQELIATQANYKLVAEMALRFGYRVSLQQHKLLGLR